MNTPLQIAENYITIGKGKTELPIIKTLLLAILAGFFIALAGVGATVAGVGIKSASVAKFLGACIFPAGLAMVLIAGSELFTGNSLLVIPLLTREIKFAKMLRNWVLVYIGNFLGSLIISAFCTYGHVFSLFGNATAESVVNIAAAKVNMPFSDALIKGVLCNLLVCIAVWMAFSAKDTAGKIIGLFFPIMIFVLCGFEHSVANMYYIPAGILTAKEYGISAENLTWGAFFVRNLIPVTIGNIIGGGTVGVFYWAIYLKKDKK